jgi:inosine/guanosine/xanthosine phosphorylase family protein
MRNEDIPNFPRPTVLGHAGEVRVNRSGPQPFIHLAGRAHYYEGIPAWQLALQLWTLSKCGVEEYVSISACGALSNSVQLGDCVLIHDFINFAGVNPLRGITTEDGVMQFPSMREIADADMAAAARAAAACADIRLQRGVYAMMAGPAYETLAEIEMLRRLGADVVGMSTVPELMVAHALGLQCLALGIITNQPYLTMPLHTNVVSTAQSMQASISRWLEAFLAYKESC